MLKEFTLKELEEILDSLMYCNNENVLSIDDVQLLYKKINNMECNTKCSKAKKANESFTLEELGEILTCVNYCSNNGVVNPVNSHILIMKIADMRNIELQQLNNRS